MTLSSGLVAACAGRTDVPPSASAPASAGTGVPPTTPVPATSPTAARSSATASAPELPAARPWVARAGEVQPSVKERATSLIEAVGSWTGGAGDLTHARARAEAAGHPSSLVDALAPLLGPEPSAVTIVRDAQYGGILSSSASVLVVADQWRARSDGHVTPGGTTLDVRLVAAIPRWRVVEVLPARPGRAAAALSRVARNVLSDNRIRLPYAARSDVLSGNVHDSVLGLLAAMAREHVVDVSVIRSGHPLYVFGTSRTSDHPRGRAVDVWALDERPLVLPSNHSLAASAMRYAVAHGAYNVGGPVLLAGSAYFTNRTHQDHIHLGLPG